MRLFLKSSVILELFMLLTVKYFITKSDIFYSDLILFGPLFYQNVWANLLFDLQIIK